MQIDRITIVYCGDQYQKDHIDKWLKDLHVGSTEGIRFFDPHSCQNNPAGAAGELNNLSVAVRTAQPNGVDLMKLRLMYVLDEYTVDSFESIKEALYTNICRMYNQVMLDIVFKTDRVSQGCTMKDVWQKISDDLPKDKPRNVFVKISLFSQFADDGAIFRNADSDVAGLYIALQSCGKLTEIGTDLKVYAYSSRQLQIREDDIQRIIRSLVKKKAETLFYETTDPDYNRFIAEVVCRGWLTNEGGRFRIDQEQIRKIVKQSMPVEQFFCTFVPETENDVQEAIKWFMGQEENLTILRDRIPDKILKAFKDSVIKNLEDHPSFYNLDTVRFLRTLSQAENAWDTYLETPGNFPEFDPVGFFGRVFGRMANSHMDTMYRSAHRCVTACENITLNELGERISQMISDLASEVENRVHERRERTIRAILDIAIDRDNYRFISDQEITRFELQNRDFIQSIREAVDRVVKRQSFDDAFAHTIEDVFDRWNEDVRGHCEMRNTIEMLNGMNPDDIISNRAYLEENPVYLMRGGKIKQNKVADYAVISFDASKPKAIASGADIGKYERLEDYENITCIYEYQLIASEKDENNVVHDVEDAHKVIPDLGRYEAYPIIPENGDNRDINARREYERENIRTVVNSATEESTPVVIDMGNDWDISVPRWAELENTSISAKFEQMTDSGEWIPFGNVDQGYRVGPEHGSNIVLSKRGKYGMIRIALSWRNDHELIVVQGLKYKCTCTLREKRGKIEVGGDNCELIPNTLVWNGETPPLVCVKYDGYDYHYYLRPNAEQLFVASDGSVKIVAIRSDKYDVTML